MDESVAVLQAGLPPAMEGLVADVVLENKNTLTHNRVYSKLGSTAVLASEPAVLHFGGFAVGEVYRQVLRVRNISGASTRVHIIPPATPFFKARCDEKKGMLAPGMAELIDIEFCPQAYKYYHDCVRIHSEVENMVIPIHGYPVMNETKFPRRVDFGKVALGDRVTRRLKLECKVPIEFEFEAQVLKANPCYTVEPLRGTVPAHGAATITITFTPLTLATETTELEVRVSEFGRPPARCVVTGSVVPGLAKDRALLAALTASDAGVDPAALPTDALAMRVTMEQLDGKAMAKATLLKHPIHKGGGKPRGGGAGGGDAYTVLVAESLRDSRPLRDCRTTGPITAKLPDLPPPPAEAVVDGVYIPPSLLHTTAEVAYVLNQEPGKLRIKDVKEAIRSKKVEQEAHRVELAAIMAHGINSGVHPLERPEVPAHIKAALFTQLLATAEEKARRVALGSGVSIGDDVMCVEEVAEAQRLREHQHTAHQRNTELADSQRLEAVCEPAGALHLALARGSGGSSGGAQGDAWDGWPQGLNGAAFAATALSTDHQYTPTWRLIEANSLEKRAASLIRFQRAVWRSIYGARLRKNLARIQGVLAQLGWDKQRLAEESANPVLLISESDRPGTAPTAYLKPDNVRTRPLPLFRDINFVYHGSVAGSHYTDFDELGPKAPREPLEYQVLGYAPEAFPGLTPYTPPLLDQPMESGAVEELRADGLQPCGAFGAADVAGLPAMPDAMKQAPFTTLEIGNRYTEDKVYVLPEPSWGMDIPYLIQPCIVPFLDSAEHEALPSMSTRALGATPCLSSIWLPRTQFHAAGEMMREAVPPFMSGSAGDQGGDGEQGGDQLATEVKIPSNDQIGALLPQGMPNMLLVPPGLPGGLSASSSLSSAAVQQHIYSTTLAAGGGQGEVAFTAAASAEYGVDLFEVPRAVKHAELDAQKRALREAAMLKMETSKREWLSKVKLPHV